MTTKQRVKVLILNDEENKLQTSTNLRSLFTLADVYIPTTLNSTPSPPLLPLPPPRSPPRTHPPQPINSCGLSLTGTHPPKWFTHISHRPSCGESTVFTGCFGPSCAPIIACCLRIDVRSDDWLSMRTHAIGPLDASGGVDEREGGRKEGREGGEDVGGETVGDFGLSSSWS